MKSVLFTVLISLCLFACRKPENRLCFKSNGEEKTIEHYVGAFTRLKLHPHIAYVIVQDSLDKIEVTGGANIVNHITWSMSNGELSIENTNKCSFLRKSSQELVVTIHCTEIYNIHYEGTEYLRSVGTIHSDYFVLQVRDGAGPVTLALQSKVIDADISHGWGDYTITGETEVAKISARSNGYCNTYGLHVTDSLYVASETPGIVKVRADGIPMTGYSKGSGDIWYQGTPTYIDVFLSGKGQVVNKN